MMIGPPKRYNDTINMWVEQSKYILFMTLYHENTHEYKLYITKKTVESQTL